MKYSTHSLNFFPLVISSLQSSLVSSEPSSQSIPAWRDGFWVHSKTASDWTVSLV